MIQLLTHNYIVCWASLNMCFGGNVWIMENLVHILSCPAHSATVQANCLTDTVHATHGCGTVQPQPPISFELHFEETLLVKPTVRPRRDREQRINRK